MQFLEHPNAAILRQYGRGAHSFLCLDDYPILASNRDPTMYEFGARPTTDKELYVSIHSGGHTVNPERYMETVAALKPDMYVTLCDEVTSDAKPKRVATSIKRTTAWLDACLQLHATYQQSAQQGAQQGQGPQSTASAAAPADGRDGSAGSRGADASGNDVASSSGRHEGADAAGSENGCSGSGSGCGASAGPLSGSMVLAALTGGALPAERAKAAAAVGDKEGVGGYALCGLGTGEPPESRPGLIAASLGALPSESLDSRPVFASGLVTSPEELLEAVAAGVDLLDCAYVAQVTAGGYALTFPLRPPPDWRPASGAEAQPAQPAEASAAPPAADAVAVVTDADGPRPDVTIGADDTKINLWSTSYRLDKRPLLAGCGCFACRQHSRAYVHHLLNTHEMLADVLLEAHNTSHFNAFCQAVREAIAEGRFEAYRAWFRSLRDAPLVAAPRRTTAKRRALGPPSGAEGGASEAAEAEAVVVAEPEAMQTEAAGTAGKAKWVRV